MMPRNARVTVEDNNLSFVWARAFLATESAAGGEVHALMAVVRDIGMDPPSETPTIRTALDETLAAHGDRSVQTTANTIFPSIWRPDGERHVLYERYVAMLPRLRRASGNRSGIYFQRLIAFGPDEDPMNQLEHIISTYRARNHRRSALQAAVFDPLRDHSRQRQRGFPCLQHVFFTPDDGRLDVTAVYANQYVFDRAYGNYLGLCRLGRFMAHEMGLVLRDVRCYAAVAQLGGPSKRALSALTARARAELGGIP